VGDRESSGRHHRTPFCRTLAVCVRSIIGKTGGKAGGPKSNFGLTKNLSVAGTQAEEAAAQEDLDNASDDAGRAAARQALDEATKKRKRTETARKDQATGGELEGYRRARLTLSILFLLLLVLLWFGDYPFCSRFVPCEKPPLVCPAPNATKASLLPCAFDTSIARRASDPSDEGCGLRDC